MRILSLVSLFTLAACSSTQPSLYNTSADEISYQQVMQDVNSYQGETVRWGGVIASRSNGEKFSELTIVQFPLARYGKPITTEQSDGRFVVYSENFLDPMIYEVGKLVTVIGQVKETQTQKVDQKTLTLPVIHLLDNHLWPESYSQDSRPYNPKQDARFIGFGYYGTGSYSP